MLLLPCVERRLANRIPMERACVVNFLGTNPMKAVATTENVGRHGALIRLEQDVPVQPGALVAVELILNGGISPPRKCMYCQGVVVRVLERQGQPVRIGVRFDYMDFREMANVEKLEYA